MKTLHYRRHSIKDGPNNTIGPKGLELTLKEGGYAGLITDLNLNWLFHGPLERTAQTAKAFLQAYSLGVLFPPADYIKPVVQEIGTDELFREMATEQFRAAVKAGQSNFQALLAVHLNEKVHLWANYATLGVTNMFDQMDDGDFAIAFGHSPVIELVAWTIYGFQGAGLPAGWQKLNDLEGLTFEQDDADKIRVTGKISVQPDTSA